MDYLIHTTLNQSSPTLDFVQPSHQAPIATKVSQPAKASTPTAASTHVEAQTTIEAPVQEEVLVQEVVEEPIAKG